MSNQDASLAQVFQLALSHHRAGRFAEAGYLYRQILSQAPEHVESLYGLGGVSLDMRRLDQAIEFFGRAAKLKPDDWNCHQSLGVALSMQGRYAEAIASYHRALSLRRDSPQLYCNLGNACICVGDNAGAIAAFRQALALQPDNPDAAANLAIALINSGELEQAMSCCRTAVERWPDLLVFHRLLGVAHRQGGELDESIASYRQALARRPDAKIHSDMLFTLHFHPDYDRRRLFEEHAAWSAFHARPLKSQIRPHGNDRSPDRKLRLGYVGFDLGDHPLGRFFLPLLENHDRERFEIFIYCDFLRPDKIAARLRARPGLVWRSTSGISDQDAAEVIRRDGIDILVDLSMHSNNSRILMFALKPAPVQATYLAYCSTTGLETMDYRLTDQYLDPPRRDDEYYSEKSVRLDCYWCYAAPEDAPPVGPLPATAKAFTTFGSLNEFTKLSPACFSLWWRLLRQIPNSRLLLHAKQGLHRQGTLERAAREGLDPARIAFVDRLPRESYFAQHNQIDIALDPFPWAGGATTCDALWMGVPVVSLAGDTAVSRGGMSILSTIGLAALVADNHDRYMQIATELATDLPRLAAMRATMRERMRNSCLMDAPAFARNIEAAYRGMWEAWCAGT
jgi:protein O-GlcNAc transferase